MTMISEEIGKYRKFLYEYFDLNVATDADGHGYVYGNPAIVAELYNSLAKMQKNISTKPTVSIKV